MPAKATITVEHEGRTCTLRQLAEALGVTYQAIFARWQAGLRGSALAAPRRRQRGARPITAGDVREAHAAVARLPAPKLLGTPDPPAPLPLIAHTTVRLNDGRDYHLRIELTPI